MLSENLWFVNCKHTGTIKLTGNNEIHIWSDHHFNIIWSLATALNSTQIHTGASSQWDLQQWHLCCWDGDKWIWKERWGEMRLPQKTISFTHSARHCTNVQTYTLMRACARTHTLHIPRSKRCIRKNVTSGSHDVLIVWLAFSEPLQIWAKQRRHRKVKKKKKQKKPAKSWVIRRAWSWWRNVSVQYL